MGQPADNSLWLRHEGMRASRKAAEEMGWGCWWVTLLDTEPELGLEKSWRASMTSSCCVLCWDRVGELAHMDAVYQVVGSGAEEDMVSGGQLFSLCKSVSLLWVRYSASLWPISLFLV